MTPQILPTFLLIFQTDAGPQQFRTLLHSEFAGLALHILALVFSFLYSALILLLLPSHYLKASDGPLWSSDSCLGNKQSQEVKGFCKEPRLDPPCFKETCPACDADLQRNHSWAMWTYVPLTLHSMPIECSQSPCPCFSLCAGQTAIGVMQSSLQFNLLLITDKMSPKHPERMHKFRTAAELYKGKVRTNKEKEGLLGSKNPQWFLPWMGRT